METDLEEKTREELIAEVKKLRQGIRQHVTVRDTNSAGIIRRCGDYCLRKPILSRLSRSGLNSCKVASDIVSRWTSKQTARRALTKPTKNDMFG
jgi:hypothetical protein